LIHEIRSRRLAPAAQADIVVFDLAAHLGSIFEPVKNLMLAGRGNDCRASWIGGRTVMEDFAVRGVDTCARCAATPTGNTRS
jgi:cytosine/adenosine deaminase-related metal-dependent hydrolase